MGLGNHKARDACGEMFIRLWHTLEHEKRVSDGLVMPAQAGIQEI